MIDYPSLYNIDIFSVIIFWGVVLMLLVRRKFIKFILAQMSKALLGLRVKVNNTLVVVDAPDGLGQHRTAINNAQLGTTLLVLILHG